MNDRMNLSKRRKNCKMTTAMRTKREIERERSKEVSGRKRETDGE